MRRTLRAGEYAGHTRASQRRNRWKHLGALIWVAALLLPFSSSVSLLLSSLSLAVGIIAFPFAVRRLFHLRNVIFIAIFAGLLYLFSPQPEAPLRALVTAQMTARALALLVLVTGVTASLEIAEISAVFEGIGMKGLGFSLGVALNLLPALHDSSVHAWRSLVMRGGLRHKRWRALQLLLVTIVSNALGRAEEITLAAEARCFNPERSNR